MSMSPPIPAVKRAKFIVGGIFGALLVGYYGPGGLLFAGRVGTGFSEKALAALCSHEAVPLGRAGAGTNQVHGMDCS